MCYACLVFLQLLASEVRKEQNILLQCIRYIVDTDFLGHRKPPAREDGDTEEGVKVASGGAEDKKGTDGVEEKGTGKEKEEEKMGSVLVERESGQHR